MPTKNNSNNRTYHGGLNKRKLLSIGDNKPLHLNKIYYDEDVTIGNLEEAVRESVGVARDWILEVNIWDQDKILRDYRYAKDFDELHYQIIYKPEYDDKVAILKAKRKRAAQKAKRKRASQKAKRKSASQTAKRGSSTSSRGSSNGSRGSSNGSRGSSNGSRGSSNDSRGSSNDSSDSPRRTQLEIALQKLIDLSLY